VARLFGYPSWKVIVSAQRGQYLKPGSREPGFFLSVIWQGSGEADFFLFGFSSTKYFSS
jgi:hypothetical protein